MAYILTYSYVLSDIFSDILSNIFSDILYGMLGVWVWASVCPRDVFLQSRDLHLNWTTVASKQNLAAQK